MQLTGRRNKSIKIQDPSLSGNAEQKKAISERKMLKQEIMRKIDYMRQIEKKPFEKIKEELVLMEINGVIPNMEYSKKPPKYFNDTYNRWKKNQVEIENKNN